MKPMSRRRKIGLGVVAFIVVVGLGVAWWMIPPRALAFAGGHPVGLAEYAAPNPTGVPAELRAADLITRGRYLTQAADCQVCHTAEGGTPFAGGRAFKTPFGALYSPNITADPATGIGTWSDADFVRAVHQGIAKDGSHLYPAFPYESYTLLTDDDAVAIKAYLFSLPKVTATPPPNVLSFPFNQRWLMAIWSLIYNPNQRFQPHTDRSPAWNRGAYLTEGLGHCGDCHTARNLAEALDNRRKFAGAVNEGWRAYNITADSASGVGGWSDADLAQYLSTGHAAGRGSAGGPMAEVVDVSLSKLTPADIQAIVAYLRTVPAIASADLPAPRVDAASEAPKVMAAGYDPRGKQIFEEACASCHSWSGVSPLTSYATLTGNRAVNDPSGDNVASIVIAGEQRKTANGVVMMPAFGNAYSDTEIAAVSNYVTARFGAKGSNLTAKDVAKLRP
ncbi:MAG TPA: cytochrome c [Caulobacteraceae bacterium]|jgi:mono/diheme cytochrome c family protein|nr:cytochrome c [Caulobacteraceae bacterium]